MARVDPRLRPFLVDQSGVVSRRQALEAGCAPHDVERLLRRRDLVRLHPGVYVDHTGEPSWLQQGWAAVLLCWPAALAGSSALRAAEGPGSRRPVRPLVVAVARERHLETRTGIVVHRTAHLEERAQWNLGPPRLRYEEAALDVAAGARCNFDALGELSKAVQGRRTTAARLLDTLSRRERIARRAWIESVLRDVAEGACSVLEHGYLNRVERRHGLSRARRQIRDRAGAGVVYRDVEYAGGLVVELDGRLFHDTTAQRDTDFDRDLLAAVAGKDTVRLSYGQVFDRPCWTAGHVAALLRSRGWRGTPRRCGPPARSEELCGASDVHAASDPPRRTRRVSGIDHPSGAGPFRPG
jgi:hypothetical protein